MDIFGYDPVYTEEDTFEYAVESAMRQQNHVHLAMMTGPIYPATKFAMGEDRKQIAFTQGLAAFETFLFYRALNYTAPFAEKVFAKTVAKKAVLGPMYVPATVAGVSVVGAQAYIDTIGEYEPDGNVHDKSSFWQSISAAMAGTFGGFNVV